MNDEIVYTRLVHFPYLLGYVFLSFFLALFVQEKSNDLLDRENIELMPIPPTSQRNSNAAAILVWSENIDDDEEEEDSFTTQQLFSFAWQIAKGMVGINKAISK